VSAFANAAGGQIVYNVTEHDHLQDNGLDGGVVPSQFPGIRFEQNDSEMRDTMRRATTPELFGASPTGSWQRLLPSLLLQLVEAAGDQALFRFLVSP